MKTVLVTGCSGFTGQYVCKAFRNVGFNVVGLAHNETSDSDYACDLTDFDAVRSVIGEVRPHGIVHLAALAFVGHDDESAFYQTNIFGTLNLLKALEVEGIEPDKVVIASSANVYGVPVSDFLDEQCIPSPVNHYAASKLAMEFMVKTWFPKMPILLTRPFNYTGPGQDEVFLVPKIVNHFRERESKIELGNLDVQRDFSDVRDVAQAYLKLYESNGRSDVVNISSGKVYALSEIIDLMNEIAGYTIEVVVNPDFVRSNEIKVLCGNNQKLRELTGYESSISFPQTLRDMYLS